MSSTARVRCKSDSDLRNIYKFRAPSARNLKEGRCCNLVKCALENISSILDGGR